MPYKKQKAIRSNKKGIIYDLMTDLGLIFQVGFVLVIIVFFCASIIFIFSHNARIAPSKKNNICIKIKPF